MKTKNIKSFVLIVLGVSIITTFLGYEIYDFTNSKNLNKDFTNIQYEKPENNSNIDETIDKKEQTSTIDWNKIKNINADVIAWIRIPNTNINYPVLKGQNDNTYLRHNLYHNYSRNGSIFASQFNKNPFNDFNTVIYGHNRENGLMFSQLKQYKNADFYNSHKYIYVYFPDGERRRYQIVSFHIVDDGDPKIYNYNIENFDEYKPFIDQNNILENIVLENDSEIQKVLTLSTCTNRKTNERYVVHAIC